MITIEMSGGLGNQMFQYALYLKLKAQGKRVRFDMQEYNQSEAFRKYSLDIFGIDMYSIPYCLGESLGYKMLNRVVNHKLTYDEVALGKVGEYQPEVFSVKNGRLRGYWQSEGYFVDISNIIREAYTFDEGKIKIQNAEFADRLSKKESVSVHIRRGDYLDSINASVYGSICDKNYYERAINYFEKNMPSCKFYLFSDDVEWTRTNIFKEGMHVVDWNVGNDSWQDMYLMSKCKHHIIANSTFSWWGAWLGDNPDKIVVSPSKWFANHTSTGMICDEWIRL